MRLRQNENTTLGQITVNGQSCYTLEDTLRHEKIKKVTAIPAGRYNIQLRPWGRISDKYLASYGKDFHKGTLWLRHVPNFQYILIHKGNTKEHTEGCILIGKTVGRAQNGDYKVFESEKAYLEFYPIVRDALVEGKEVFIEIENHPELKIY